MKVSRTRSAIIVSCATVLGLGIGGGVVAFAGEGDVRPAASDIKLQGPVGVDGKADLSHGMNDITPGTWPENEFGLTVGEPTRADVLARNLPSLMPILMDDGKTGYLLSEEAYPETKTLAEEVQRTESLLNEKGQDIRTVYGPNGKTVLGTKLVATVTFK